METIIHPIFKAPPPPTITIIEIKTLHQTQTTTNSKTRITKDRKKVVNDKWLNVQTVV